MALSTSEHLTNDVEGDGESMSLIDESVPSPSANRRGNRTADSNGKQGVVSYHDDSDEVNIMPPFLDSRTCTYNYWIFEISN